MPKKESTGRKRVRTLAFKATPELERRLEGAAAVTGLSKSAIFLAAVEAVVAAIERDGGIVVPMEMFQPARVPVFSVFEAPPAALTDPERLIAAERERRQGAPTAAATGGASRAASHEATGAGPSARS